MTTINMPTKLRIIGASYHLIVPMEYVKVFNLNKFLYNFGVDKQGNIVYTKAGVVPEEQIAQEIEQ
jgi:hypothetical protein